SRIAIQLIPVPWKARCFMMKKIQRSVLAISLLALALAAVSLPVHAQPTVNARADKSAYAPGDSGTMTISIINTIGNPLLVRNITIYYPWAGYDTNGKWFSANYTYPVSPPRGLSHQRSQQLLLHNTNVQHSDLVGNQQPITVWLPGEHEHEIRFVLWLHPSRNELYNTL